jgi:hypothetical protein
MFGMTDVPNGARAALWSAEEAGLMQHNVLVGQAEVYLRIGNPMAAAVALKMAGYDVSCGQKVDHKDLDLDGPAPVLALTYLEAGMPVHAAAELGAAGWCPANYPVCPLPPPAPCPPEASAAHGFGSACPSCKGFGEVSLTAAPLCRSVTGSGIFDAAIGGAIGYFAAPVASKKIAWGMGGAAAAYLAGVLGMIGTGVAAYAARR